MDKEVIQMKQRHIVSFVIPFIMLLFFFLVVKPIILYDTDDWTYISLFRIPLPQWGSWNPGKVFPETMMTFISFVGIKGFEIFGISLPQALLVTNAMFFAVLIAYYMSLLLTVNKDVKFENKPKDIVLALMIMILHFLAFKAEDSNNAHMFWAHNMTCYYNYVLPSMINITIVLIMEKQRIDGNAKNIAKYALLTYIAIFSNLFSNVILMAYIGVKLIDSTVNGLRNKRKVGNLIVENAFFVYIIALWIICAIFEVNGARSHNISAGLNLDILGSVKVLAKFYSQGVNKIFLGITIGAIVVNLKYGFQRKQTLSFFSAFLLSNIYLVLLTSKTGAYYLSRADIQNGPFFFLIAINCICLSSLMMKFNENGIGVFSLVSFLLFFLCFNGGEKTYMNCSTGNIDYKHCLAVDEYIIQKAQEADRNGDSNVEISVPIKNGSSDNYPHADYGGARISTTLYRYGLTNKVLTIDLIPDQWANDYFKIYY